MLLIVIGSNPVSSFHTRQVTERDSASPEAADNLGEQSATHLSHPGFDPGGLRSVDLNPLYLGQQANTAETHFIRVIINPSAGGQVLGGGEVGRGEVVTLQARPNAGYLFARWEEGDLTVSLEQDYTFTVEEDRELAAVFRPLEEEDKPVQRLMGADREQTAVQISLAGWPFGAETVMLANSRNFPDALAGVPLAYHLDAPILLTAQASLHPETREQIIALGATRVIMLGGPEAISTEVEEALDKIDQVHTVERIGGENRYLTAAAIASRLAEERGAIDRAFITYSRNYPDALAAASYAAQNGAPILLTDSGQLHEATAGALQNLGISETIIVGGTSVIGKAVEEELKQLTATERVAGVDREATAIALAEAFLADDSPCFYVATGWNFPDALAGGVLAAREGSGVILVHGEREALSPGVRDFVAAGQERFVEAYIFGGTRAVSFAIEEELDELLMPVSSLPKEIIALDSEELTLPNDVQFDQVSFPTAIETTVRNTRQATTTIYLGVTWHDLVDEDFDGPGKYVFNGTVDLPAGLSNPRSLMAEFTVTVLDINEYALAERAVFLEDSTLQALDGLAVEPLNRAMAMLGDNQITTLYFNHLTFQLENLVPGDVIIGGITEWTPYGFLGKVRAVRVQTNEEGQFEAFIVITEPASLEEAIEHGAFRWEETLTVEDLDQSSLALEEQGITLQTVALDLNSDDEDEYGVLVEFEDVMLHDDDYSYVKIDGAVLLKLTPHILLNISWFRLVEMGCVVDIEVVQKLDLDVTNKLMIDGLNEYEPLIPIDLDLQHTLFRIPLTLQPIWVGILCITPTLTMYVGMDGEIHAEIDFSFEQRHFGQASVTWHADEGYRFRREPFTDQLIKPIEDPPGIDNPLELVNNLLSMMCARKANEIFNVMRDEDQDVLLVVAPYIGADIDFLIYGQDFIRLQNRGSLEFKTEANFEPPFWTLTAGYNLGFRLDPVILSKFLDPYERELYHYETILRDSQGNIVFACPFLEAAVRAQIKKPRGGIFIDDVRFIRELDASGLDVSDLRGLEFMDSLERLLLNDNRLIADSWDNNALSSLMALQNLEHLELSNNERLHNLAPLGPLGNLQHLDIGNNQDINNNSLFYIRNLPLRHLDASACDIDSLQNLSNMETLEYLDVSHNKIRGLKPLEKLLGLNHINLLHNDIQPGQTEYLVSILRDGGFTQGAGIDIRYNFLDLKPDSFDSENIKELLAAQVEILYDPQK